MEQYLGSITEFVAQYGYFFIIPLIALENVPIVGFLAPGISVLFLTGYFATVLPGGPITAFMVAWITIILADTLWYLIGYYFHNHSGWIATVRKNSPNVEELLTTQPVYALALYQFAPYLRMFLPFGLGVYRYSVWRWGILVTIGSGLFTAVFFAFGMLTAQLIGNVTESTSALETLSLVVGGIGIVYLLFLLTNYLKIRIQNKNKLDNQG